MKSALLCQIGVPHGFGDFSEPIPTDFLSRWQERPQKTQVHGVSSCEVTHPAQQCGEVDAVYALKPNLMVPVITADCVPILMVRNDAGAVAACHAGWRGTLAGMAEEIWKTLIQKGENPRNWSAAVGPAIGPCCYEVSAELASEFQARFQNFSTAGAEVPANHLDLPGLNTAALRNIGLSRVDLIRACTQCSFSESTGLPLFNSFRRDGRGKHQWSVAMSVSL